MTEVFVSGTEFFAFVEMTVSVRKTEAGHVSISYKREAW